MKIKLLILLAGFGLMAAASNASAYMVSDSYYGADDHGYGDIIASSSDKLKFDIQSADVTRSGNSLTVKVYTGFAGRAGEMGFKGYTRGRKGLGYGDLFLSTGWSPFGTDPHYLQDNAANGNHWTYAFALDDPFSKTGGSGNVYKLAAGIAGNNNPSALLSNYFMTGATYRDGQAVAVDEAGLMDVGDGTWTVGTNFLSFTLADISGLNLDPNQLGLHWAMYCANDVIEGLDPANVPDPNTISLFLLGLGLLGLGYIRQGRRTAVPA